MSSLSHLQSHIAPKRTVQIALVTGIVSGMLCLLSGSCVILIWAFMSDSSTLHPVGLRIGAIVCVFGVLLVLSCFIGLYRWHLLSGRAVNIPKGSQHEEISKRKLGSVYEFSSPESLPWDLKPLTRLKKANSAVYVPFGSLQPEKFKFVGLLRANISATDLNRPLRKSVSAKCSNHGHSTVAFENEREAKDAGEKTMPLFAAYNKALSRDKAIRRSLPRVLVHPPNANENNSHITSRISSERLAKARSEGIELDELARPAPTETTHSAEGKGDKQAKSARRTVPLNSRREVNFDHNLSNLRTSLNRVSTTPPMGQASLFNLNSSECATSSVPTALTESTLTPTKTTLDSGHSCEGTASAKRFLLMSQSGQLISCTTLFDDEMDDDSAGVGCKRLQPRSGWNFFPIFVDSDKFEVSAISDDESSEQKTGYTSQSVHNAEFQPSGTSEEAQHPAEVLVSDSAQSHSAKKNVLYRLFLHLRNIRPFKSTRMRNVKKPETKASNYADETADAAEKNELTRSGPSRSRKRSRVEIMRELDTEEGSASDELLSTTLPVSPTSVEMDQSLCDAESLGNLKSRKHTVISNASVFSLPAIPPAMWPAERPVWIMGVPVDDDPSNRWVAVDACDFIVLKKEDKADSADPVHPVTGSSSSVYAFHVRPPSRLRPTASAKVPTSHNRARSLGRMLISERQYVQPT
ncbi:unnamed protein product [Calicophoron daubneyi]|uniref:Uncharacterized protein n=1 Tax=Calicophoron daubneyi TaxID=300641 RepID=A0AAV2TFD7_CALDB